MTTELFILMSFPKGSIEPKTIHEPPGWIEGVFKTQEIAESVMNDMSDEFVEFRILPKPLLPFSGPKISTRART